MWNWVCCIGYRIGTEALRQRVTKFQRDIEAQRHGGTEALRHGEALSSKVSKRQRDKEAQRHKGTEARRGKVVENLKI